MKDLLPTTVVGSYPQPHWLIDREALGGKVPRVRAPEIWRIAPAYLFCDVKGLPAFGHITVPGTRTVVYEVTDPALARRLFARGVDLVETFAVGEMREALDLA